MERFFNDETEWSSPSRLCIISTPGEGGDLIVIDSIKKNL
jgi:hypothetical protein